MELEFIRDEIDERVAVAETRIISQIKNWFLMGLLGLFTTSIVGFASLMYTMGKLSERFEQQVIAVNQIQMTDKAHVEWMHRKDEIDDDLIRWAKANGYSSPAWYKGRDFDEVRK